MCGLIQMEFTLLWLAKVLQPCLQKNVASCLLVCTAAGIVAAAERIAQEKSNEESHQKDTGLLFPQEYSCLE